MNIIDSNLYGSNVEHKNNKKYIKLKDIFVVPKDNSKIIKEIKNTQQDLNKKTMKQPKHVKKVYSDVKTLKKEDRKEDKLNKDETISQKNLKVKIKNIKKYEL